jgi:hypothetical protein
MWKIVVFSFTTEGIFLHPPDQSNFHDFIKFFQSNTRILQPALNRMTEYSFKIVINLVNQHVFPFLLPLIASLIILSFTFSYFHFYVFVSISVFSFV